MTILGKVLAGIAGASLAVSPVLAAPVDRGSSTPEGVNEMGGGATWIGIVGALLVVALAAIAAFGDDDEPVSP